jgi:hypothetical protein
MHDVFEGSTMTGFRTTMLAAIGGVALLAAAAGSGLAQSAALDQQLVGTWWLTQYGAKADGLGPHAVGMLIIAAGGSFALQIANADMAPFASDDRRSATPAESQASGRASLAYFGTYTAADASHGLMLHIMRCSFPNWSGQDQDWTVSVAPDKLTLTSRQDRGIALVWTRVVPGKGATYEIRSGRRVIGF